MKGLLYEDLSRKKELFKKRKKEYIKLARSTKIVGNNIQLKKEKSIKKRRAEKEKWYWVTEMNRAASGNRYSSDVHVSRSIRTEDNFIVLYRVREICREFILGQLSQREFYDSNVYFFFFFFSSTVVANYSNSICKLQKRMSASRTAILITADQESICTHYEISSYM